MRAGRAAELPVHEMPEKTDVLGRRGARLLKPPGAPFAVSGGKRSRDGQIGARRDEEQREQDQCGRHELPGGPGEPPQ